MNRRQITILLLVVLCFSIGYAWIATPKQRRVAPGQSNHRQTDLQPQKETTVAFSTISDLDFSASGNNQYQKPQKNLFAPLYLPPKTVKPRSTPRPVAKVIRPVVKPQKVTPIIIQPQDPKPIQSFNVLGYLNKAGEYTVFLASRQGDIYLVKTGDGFADNLIVNNINSKEITISRKQTDLQVSLPLGEAKSQRLPRITLQSDRPQFKIPPETAPSKPKTGGATEIDKKRLIDDVFK